VIYCVEHSVLNRFVNTASTTQCLAHSNFNTVFATQFSNTAFQVVVKNTALLNTSVLNG
jgi:hypothetical protein